MHKRLDVLTMLRKLSCLFLLFASCGFKAASVQEPVTVSVPFCEGDPDGRLTANVIEEIENRGIFCYSQNASRYELKIKILDSKYSNIGYHYAGNPEKRKNLKANESRIKVLAEVQVVDTVNNKVIIGPAHIAAWCDFDHLSYNIDHHVNSFSLGQLTDVDTTADVTNIPLFRNLAKEIAQYLQDNMELAAH
jgi:hypothetical protein